MSKIKLSDRAKARIKSKFASIDPQALKPGERLYYNKVKAGKARAASAFHDASGKYLIVPQKIVDTYVIPVLKKNNPDFSQADLKAHLRDNKEVLKRITRDESINAFYQGKNIENALLQINDLTRFYVDDGDGLREVSKDKLFEKVKKYESKLMDQGAFGFFTKVSFKKGFGQMIVYLPKFNDIEDLDGDEDIFAIMSDPKNKKKRKRTDAEKATHNAYNKKYRENRKKNKNG